MLKREKWDKRKIMESIGTNITLWQPGVIEIKGKFVKLPVQNISKFIHHKRINLRWLQPHINLIQVMNTTQAAKNMTLKIQVKKEASCVGMFSKYAVK